jgi:EmrB/QacA subfamily drug resistance transporter
MTNAANPSCDRSLAQGTPAAAAVDDTDLSAAGRAGSAARTLSAGRERGVLATCILASGLMYIDGSVVNVGLAAIGRSLTAPPEALPWVINGYLLPLSAMLLLGGAIGDQFGRRRTLLRGMGLFALGSALCAVAPHLGVLIAGRCVQGAGAALLAPNSLAILGQSFSGARKGRAVGIWAAAGAIAGAVGPVLGGWLIDLGSWRAIFLINLPLCAIAGALAVRYVPADAQHHGGSLDVVGGALATLGLGAITWSLTLGSGPHGWTAQALGMLGAAVLLLLGFCWVERGRGERAMMPLGLFASAPFVGLTLLTLFLYGALGEAFVLLPFALIRGARYEAVMAGAALLPVPIVLALFSPLMGSLVARIGERIPLAVGPVVVGLGFALALRIGGEAPYWSSVLPCVLLIALGLSLAVAPLTTAILSSVDAQRTALASGINSAVAELGGLVATALLTSVLASSGAALFASFHTAMLLGAIACGVASLGTLGLKRGARPGG